MSRLPSNRHKRASEKRFVVWIKMLRRLRLNVSSFWEIIFFLILGNKYSLFYVSLQIQLLT